MKSALFVDFDNVFSSLRRLDPVAAERFAFRPLSDYAGKKVCVGVEAFGGGCLA
jgi:hypothetical protein